MEIASTGHSSTQTPQSVQLELSTLAFASPFMAIALAGHAPTQASHPVHFSLSTNAGISNS
jgi:hypothetical protein